MTGHSALLRLHDIRDAIQGIFETISGVTFQTYCDVWHIRRATERGIEIISEASRHIPDQLKAKQAHIPWQEIAAIGNILRHEYARIEDEIIWQVTQRYLADLRSAIDDMIAEAGRSESTTN